MLFTNTFDVASALSHAIEPCLTALAPSGALVFEFTVKSNSKLGFRDKTSVKIAYGLSPITFPWKDSKRILLDSFALLKIR